MLKILIIIKNYYNKYLPHNPHLMLLNARRNEVGSGAEHIRVGREDTARNWRKLDFTFKKMGLYISYAPRGCFRLDMYKTLNRLNFD